MLNQSQINEAVKYLKTNQIAILPTDTIYGLSAMANSSNQAKINQIKQSDLKKPITILISSLNDLFNLQIFPTNEERNIMLSTTPTTLIFSNKEEKVFGVRLVSRIDIQKIIKKVGPIFSSSVNIHNHPPINSYKELHKFNPDVAVFFDNDLSNNKPSKIYNTITKEWIR